MISVLKKYKGLDRIYWGIFIESGCILKGFLENIAFELKSQVQGPGKRVRGQRRVFSRDYGLG